MPCIAVVNHHTRGDTGRGRRGGDRPGHASLDAPNTIQIHALCSPLHFILAPRPLFKTPPFLIGLCEIPENRNAVLLVIAKRWSAWEALCRFPPGWLSSRMGGAGLKGTPEMHREEKNGGQRTAHPHFAPSIVVRHRRDHFPPSIEYSESDRTIEILTIKQHCYSISS